MRPADLQLLLRNWTSGGTVRERTAPLAQQINPIKRG